MNRTGIEYLHFTWNAAVGCSGSGCGVKEKCWARAQAKRQKHRCCLCYNFYPHFHKERLTQPMRRRTPSRIGVCFMGEIFDSRMKPAWIEDILTVINYCSWHQFIALTKQPQNRVKLLGDSFFPLQSLPNLCLGVSVNRRCDQWRIDKLKESRARVKAVSFEPLYESMGALDLTGIDWIIIGAQTRPELQPDPIWVEDLMQEARNHKAAIFIKNNVAKLPNFRMLQEYPGSFLATTEKEKYACIERGLIIEE